MHRRLSFFLALSLPVALVDGLHVARHSPPPEPATAPAKTPTRSSVPAPAPLRRTALCMPREGQPVARAGADTGGTDHWSIDCGEDFVLPCDRGTLCAGEHCTCRCDEPHDCSSAALFMRQTYGAEIGSNCLSTACSWSRLESHP